MIYLHDTIVFFLPFYETIKDRLFFMQHFSLSDFPYITVTAISIKTLKITKKIFSDKNFSQQMDV